MVMLTCFCTLLYPALCPSHASGVEKMPRGGILCRHIIVVPRERRFSSIPTNLQIHRRFFFFRKHTNKVEFPLSLVLKTRSSKHNITPLFTTTPLALVLPLRLPFSQFISHIVAPFSPTACFCAHSYQQATRSFDLFNFPLGGRTCLAELISCATGRPNPVG